MRTFVRIFSDRCHGCGRCRRVGVVPVFDDRPICEPGKLVCGQTAQRAIRAAKACKTGAFNAHAPIMV